MSTENVEDQVLIDALAERLATAHHDLDDLERSIVGMVAKRDELRLEVHHINALLDLNGPTRDDKAAEIDGKSSSDLVFELLQLRGPLHFRKIEEILRDEFGVQVSGADPANTLLARYYNDPRLYRPKRGTYAIRKLGAARSVGARKGKRRNKRR